MGRERKLDSMDIVGGRVREGVWPMVLPYWYCVVVTINNIYCSCYESSTISIYGYTEAIEITLKQYLCLACIYGATDTLLTISNTYEFS